MEKKLLEKFQELYGEGGDIRNYFSPGRVNLIGEHTDYNGGHVFPCALTIGTYAVVRKRSVYILRTLAVQVFLKPVWMTQYTEKKLIGQTIQRV